MKPRVETLIVSKTHMQALACVGGYALEAGKNVRLMQRDGSNQPGNTDLEVGQVWNLVAINRQKIEPPHVEDILVFDRTYLRDQPNVLAFLNEHVEIWDGGVTTLFEGRLRFTHTGSGYIDQNVPLPSMSVGFWRLPMRLTYRMMDDRRYYVWEERGEARKLAYVGYAPPLPHLETGTLLRVSLSRWWQQEKAAPLRCYLQLSGWFL